VPSCRFSVAMCSDVRLAVLLGRLAKAAGRTESRQSWMAGQGRPPSGGLAAWRPWGCRAAKQPARRPHANTCPLRPFFCITAPPP
jgi:hypothetical protein